MKKRSELALGTWQFGPSHGFWSDADTHISRSTIRTALKAGIRHFDTAPAYGSGMAEQLLGSVVSQTIERSLLRIDTKFMPKDPLLVEQDVHKSLNRLKTPYIDTLYLHWPSSNLPLRPIMQAAERLMHTGKVRSLGICNTPISLLRHLEDIPISFIQIPCSLIWTRDLEAFIGYAELRHISLVGYSPLALGLLGGNHTEKPHDSRGNLYVFWESAYPIYQQLRTLIASLAEAKKVSMADIALAWAMGQGFETIIVGARNPQQLDLITKKNRCSLDEEEKSLLDEVAGRLHACAPPLWDNLFGHRW